MGIFRHAGNVASPESRRLLTSAAGAVAPIDSSSGVRTGFGG